MKWNLDLNAESAAGEVLQGQMLCRSVKLAEAGAGVGEAETGGRGSLKPFLQNSRSAILYGQ
jgi:hypothetical protein